MWKEEVPSGTALIKQNDLQVAVVLWEILGNVWFEKGLFFSNVQAVTRSFMNQKHD